MVQPELRFPEFTNEWEGAPFGTYLTEVKDKTKEENETTLLSSAIEGMFLNSELFGHQRGSSNIGYKKIKKGMLILSAQNLHLGNANVNLRFEEGMVSPAYNTYNIHDCDTEFMAQWIKRDATNTFFYNATTVGASVCRRNVDWKMLYASTVYFPSMEEQEKIAAFLSTIDEKIALQKKLVDEYKTQKKGLMQKLFDKELQFSKPDGTPFPEWKYEPLGEACQINPRSKNLPDEFYYIDLGSVTSGVWVERKIVQKSEAPSRAQRLLAYNDILFQTVRPYLQNNYMCLEEMDLPMVGSTGFAQIKCKENNPQYIFQLIHSNSFMAEVNIRCTGTGYPAINADGLSEIVIPIPSIEEQTKIAEFLSLLDEKIIIEAKILEDWVQLKKALLQQMFV